VCEFCVIVVVCFVLISAVCVYDFVWIFNRLRECKGLDWMERTGEIDQRYFVVPRIYNRQETRGMRI
jgi:hypothetical protein